MRDPLPARSPGGFSKQPSRSECAVVIATHNRARELRETLERLYDLPERPLLVVADNASTDATDRVWKPFANRALFLKLRRNIGAAARTIGAREAGTPFVAFCDDDCTWEAGALARGMQHFADHPRLGLINARVVIGEGDRTDPACERMRCCTNDGLPGAPIVYFMAGACLARTTAFLEAGGYDRRYFIGAEETLLALDLAALGWHLRYCEDLLLRHRPSATNRDPQRRRRLVLRNRLWTVLLRRSGGCAVRVLAQYARLAAADAAVRAALRDAVASLPWLLRERRCLPPEIEHRVARLDALLTP